MKTERGLLDPAKRLAEKLWYSRSRHRFIDVPIPCRLPYGGWFLARGDAMGARVAGYRLSRSPYEEGQWRLVARLLAPGGTFVDVGANQGFYTILASRLVGATGRVYAFEPAPTEAGKLRSNLRLNRCRNVIVEEIAVGAADGHAPFHLYLGHQGSWSGLRKGASDVAVKGRVIDVPVVRLDDYFASRPLERLDIMKIDVEGGELPVLQGAAGLIGRFRPIIICEVEPRRTAQWGYDAGAILKALEKMDYRWRSVTRDGRLGGEPRVSGWQNLAAIPAEKVADLAAVTLG
jgi:FkbM family methyltransferase